MVIMDISWWFHQQQWWFSRWFKQQEWCLFSRVLIGILCGSTSPNGRTFVGELSFIVHLYTTQCDTLIHTCSDTYTCIWLYIYIYIYTYSNINRYIIVISSYIYIYILYTLYVQCSKPSVVHWLVNRIFLFSDNPRFVLDSRTPYSD